MHAVGKGGRLPDRRLPAREIGIVDGSWLTLGSANLNSHSRSKDTDTKVVTHAAA
jgi:hypothetical protein